MHAGFLNAIQKFAVFFPNLDDLSTFTPGVAWSLTWPWPNSGTGLSSSVAGVGSLGTPAGLAGSGTAAAPTANIDLNALTQAYSGIQQYAGWLNRHSSFWNQKKIKKKEHGYYQTLLITVWNIFWKTKPWPNGVGCTPTYFEQSMKLPGYHIGKLSLGYKNFQSFQLDCWLPTG